MVLMARLRPRHGALAGLAALAGLWGIAGRAERGLVSETDRALARHASSYLAVATPVDTGGGYDAIRLLAIVHDLASASFWPGGLQVAVGRTALLPDTLELLPLPDTTAQRLAAGGSLLTSGLRGPMVAVVPLAGPDRVRVAGWVAVWGSVARHRVLPHGRVLVGLAAVACLVLALGRGGVSRQRHQALLAAGLVGLAGADLALGVHATARRATDTHLLALGRLVQLASTRVGIRQALVPELATGVESRWVSAADLTDAGVVRSRSSAGPVARLVAATPRTGRGLELSRTPAESGLWRVWLAMAAWTALGVVGLGMTAGAVPLERRVPSDGVPPLPGAG